MTRSALIIVDVQNDFCEGGSLAVPNANEIITIINKIRSQKSWDLVVLTQDFHPKDHISFASNNNKSVFSTITLEDGTDQVMWPDHCVQGTYGAEFHKDLIQDSSDIIVVKGTNRNVDSYSGFFDNNRKQKTTLDDELKKANITDVYVCGLAWDYCVSFTALDAAQLGYKTYFITDATRGIAEDTIEEANKKMIAQGIQFVTSDSL